MQQALKEPMQTTNASSAPHSRSSLDKPSFESFKASAAATAPKQIANEERAVLDWREALHEAKRLKIESSLEDNALTDTFG